jgi:predicted secreted Zn-dependent protease
MYINKSNMRLVLQPENQQEQTALQILADVIRDGQSWFTLDLSGYSDLDRELWKHAEFIPKAGKNEPGARALVVSYRPPSRFWPDRELAHE